MPGINIQLTANVQNAVQGLNTVQHSLAATAAASNALGGSMTNGVRGINQASNALLNLGRVAQDAPFGFIGISNNINPLLESFQRLRAETGSVKGALSALGASLIGGGGLGLAVSVATSLMTVFAQQGLFSTTKQLDKTAEAAKQAKDAIHGIFEDTAKEATSVQSLVIVLESETASRHRKLDALKELQRIQPDIFNGLKLEGDTVKGLNIAYQTYLNSLTTIIAARIKQQQLEAITTQILEKQGVTLTGYSKIANDLGKLLSENQKKQDLLNNKPAGETKTAYDKQQQNNATQLNVLYKQQADLVKDLQDLQAGIKVPDIKDPKNVKEKIDQVAETLRKLAIDRDELAKNPLLSFDEKDNKAFDLISAAILRLKELKVADSSPIIIKLRTELDAAAAQVQIDKFRERLKKIGVSDVVMDIPVEASFKLRKDSGLVDIATKSLKDLDKLKLPTQLANKVAQSLFDPEKFKEASEKAKNYIKDMSSFVKTTIDPIFSAIFDNIGKGSQTALMAVGDAIKGVITQLIRAAAEAAVLSLILNAIMPGSGGKFSFSAMFSQLSGVPKFAQGGIAYGPTVGLFGEAGPEAIVPLDKLPDIIAKSGAGGGGDTRLYAEIRGSNIYMSNERTKTSRKRIYGK